MRVLGIDGCRRGWAGIVWDGRRVEGAFAATLAELIAGVRARGSLDCVGIDMPLGLADVGVRRADRLGQKALGRRSPSIFITPTRRSLEAQDRAEGSAINVALGGPGVTAQAWALRPKILEVDVWAREHIGSGDELTVVEVHPELSFAAMAGAPVAGSKRSWTGAAVRRRLLRDAGLELDGLDLGEVGLLADADDVVDAAGVAWTAMRVARGEARSLPDPPDRFRDGLSAAIWS
jgi:predicted RNase H-like nuclease